MKRLLFAIALFLGLGVSAQTQVTVSDLVEMHNGKKCYVHIVKKGQTVYSISRAYGLKEYEAITTKDIHQLEVGDTVWLPCKDDRIPLTSRTVSADDADYKVVTVNPGETLYSISRAYGVTVDDLIEANPGVAENGLKAGQDLRVPKKGKEKAAEKPAPAAAAPAQPAAPSAVEVPAVIKNRVDQEAFHLAVLMPLNLDQVGSISVTKFDLEQRGKKNYKSFEFVQFYEGLRLALDKLERNGISAEVNVVDVSGNTPSDVEKAWQSHNVGRSDLVIALLTKDLFAKAADLARENQVFIVNPMSSRPEIIQNPYVIKCTPSIEGQTRILLTAIHKYKPQAHLLVVHSGARAESRYLSEVTRQLQERNDIAYTLFDWKASNKLPATLKQNPGCVVLNLYDQGRDKNRIQLSNLLNRMAAMKTNTPTLMAFTDYVKEYSDVDYAQLQLLNYHTFVQELDLDQQNHQNFIDDFRAMYKTEPTDAYAFLGHDIMIYFLTGLQQQGMDFFRTLTFSQSEPKSLLFPFRFKHAKVSVGFENQTAQLQRMSEYRFLPLTAPTTKK